MNPMSEEAWRARAKYYCLEKYGKFIWYRIQLNGLDKFTPDKEPTEYIDDCYRIIAEWNTE